MTIWEISEKADYIAQRHRRLQDQWHIYCNSLVQGITLSKARLHHAMSCAPDKELCFVLFEHFRIYVTLADGFRAIAVKCDLCSFDEQGPACVRMCPTKALHLVDNTDIARVSKRKRELTFNTDFGDLTLFQQAQSGEAK